MSKEMKTVSMSTLDLSSLMSVWGKLKCDFSSAKMAVHVADAIDPIMEANKADLMSAAGGDEKAVERLLEDKHVVLLSAKAIDSLLSAINGHQGWTNRGIKQAVRIVEALEGAEE